MVPVQEQWGSDYSKLDSSAPGIFTLSVTADAHRFDFN